MSDGSLVWGEPGWVLPAAMLFLVASLVAGWSYARRPGARWVKLAGCSLRIASAALLAICLLEPRYSGTRPRPQANRFAILADDSRSMTLRDEGSGTRGEELKRRLRADATWQSRLQRDFEVRRYAFGAEVRSVAQFEELRFEANASSLTAALTSVAERLRHRPTAGILLLTDGATTDGEVADAVLARLPPVFPVIMGQAREPMDIRVPRLTVSQSNFESAPVSVVAEIASQGLAGKTPLLQLLDERGDELQRVLLSSPPDGQTVSHKFQLRPEKPGVQFYQVRVIASDEESVWKGKGKSREATLANNSRWFVVDRRQGPYRVLYVTGRPNWEFKFLRRAVASDEEIQLVGLIRIAKREPKFTFRGNQGETTNPLFRGFGNQGDEGAEQYDEPVLVRLGTEDDQELRGGFPKDPESLFRYHAIVLDDIEAAFFSQAQMSLIQQFVSQRGGGLLMLGGQESFGGGGYEHTAIAELLPVYVNAPSEPVAVSPRWTLTREGWLEPWLRLRSTESDERKRLTGMPEFRVVNRVSRLKPGATTLAEFETSDGAKLPALAVHRFGRGQVASLLGGDFWRWHLLRPDHRADSDLEKMWRQTVRWLVSDVLGRVDAVVQPSSDPTLPSHETQVQVRDEQFGPVDNASVQVELTPPSGRKVALAATSRDEQAGTYVVQYMPRELGPHRVRVQATSEEGKPLGVAEAGWCNDADTDEFRVLSANRPLLERLAQRTGGEVISGANLDAFVSSLASRKVPVTEPWTYPLWHQWHVFAMAVVCLVGEWGLRRWKGLP